MTTHDAAKAGRLARERFTKAFMSDTKWRKLIEAVAAARPTLRAMTVKFVGSDHPHKMQFPPSLRLHRPYMDTIEFGPMEFRSIEWMELSTDLQQLLDGIGHFHMEQIEGGTRVIGYES